MRQTWILLFLFLIGCSSPSFKVSTFHLRGESMLASPALMVKAEARYRFDQNLKYSDRKLKKGHYYVCRWDKSLLPTQDAPVKIQLEYRQPKTGRSIKRKEVTVNPNENKKVELKVIGEEYLKNGRILSWKVTISQNGKTLDSEQSFMWE